MEGHLEDVVVEPLGSPLLTAATAGAATITVEDPADFEEESEEAPGEPVGELLINGQSIGFTGCDQETGVITLDGTLTDAAAEGDFVAPLTAQGTPAQMWIAKVVFLGSEEPVDVTIHQDYIDEFTPGTAQAGATVSVTDDPVEGWIIRGAPTELPVEEPTAVEPPTEALTLTVQSDKVGLTAVVRGGLNPSTVLDYYLDGVLIEEGTRSAVYRFDTEADGDPMAEDIGYVVSVQPRNNVDVGTMLTADPATLDTTVDEVFIRAVIAAGFILAGAIEVANMRWDEEGFLINHPDGRQTFMKADGSGNQFIGQAILEQLTVTGAASLDGDVTANAKVILGTGVTNPTGLAGATAGSWDSLGDGSTYGYLPRGLFWDASTTRWIHTDSLLEAGNVWHINPTTNAHVLVKSLDGDFNGVGGVVKIGTTYYVLGKDKARAWAWYVYEFNSSWVKTDEFAPSGSTNDSLTLGVDGTKLLIAKRTVAGNLYVSTYDPVAETEDAFVSCGTWAGAELTGVHKRAVETATARFVVVSEAVGLRVFNTSTGARISDEEWPVVGGIVNGLGHDGSNWFSMANQPVVGGVTQPGRVYEYTNLTPNSDFSYAWVDSSTGDRTEPAPIREARPLKRAKWTISVPQEPPSGADTACLYYAEHGDTLTEQVELTPGTLSATFSSFTDTGDPPNASNDFEDIAGTLGSVESTGTHAVSGDPIIDLQGDGSYTLGHMSGDADGYGTTFYAEDVGTSNAVPTSTTNVSLPGFSIPIDSPGTGAVFKVTLCPDMSLGAAGGITVEGVIDGTTALTPAIANAGASGTRFTSSKVYFVTGLSAGAHTLTMRARSQGAYTTTLFGTQTTGFVERIA